jgi:hypothetical protein
MNKKPLQIDSISNELAGASLFFNSQVHSPAPPLIPEDQSQVPTQIEPVQPVEFGSEKEDNHASKHASKDASMLASAQDSKTAILHASFDVSNQADEQASMIASKPSDKSYDLIDTIRKTVRQVGKESLYIRLTPAEKEGITATIYTINGLYHREGSNKFTANELGRIAINFLLEDFQENGALSTLARVLDALKA